MAKRLTSEQDAFGHAVWDHYHGTNAFEIIERSDGHFAISSGPSVYLAEPAFWAPHERAALERHAHGRVLDIGCNAGRHALYLQQHGLDVLGVDVSPLSIAVAKERGLKKAEVLSIDELSAELGTFDTILMLGNNFGLFATPAKARRLLRRFKTLTSPGATLIAESLNVYVTNEPDHPAYLAANRARGRMSGQIRIRARYKRFVTPWFDYLMVSPAEMDTLLEGTGWRVAKRYAAAGARLYTTVIERAD
ncbi:MAG TPA: class I SAM-dependent methyltransferase [Gammaproteobacteria bacterium]|nr:class I SAM-dependent methyltransferase [Gammaproteobacteria bacterium]